jgi:hypothetical protein
MAGGSLKFKLPRWRDLSTSTIVAIASVVMLVLAASAHATWPSHVSVWAVGVPALALSTVVLVRLRLPIPTVMVIVAALILYAAYMTYTSYGERNFDGHEQLVYVKFIAEKWSIPGASECFVCHHPPVYYVAAAAAYRFSELTRLTHPHYGVQLLSMLVTFAFVIFGTLTIMRFTKKPWLITLAAALIAFWPYTVMNTTRLHNDPMVIMLMTATLYYLVCWYQDDKPLQMWLACALAVASVLTKTNGLIVVATIVLIVAYRFLIGPERKWLLKKVGPPVVALMIGVGAFAMLRGGDVAAHERVLGTASKIGTHEWVDNEPENYLYFDVEGFLNEPYVLTRRDGTGRQYYWNHLLKSSLFASHNEKPDAETTYRWNRRIATVMNLLLLAMLLFGAMSMALTPRRGFFHRYAVPLVSSACFLAMHMAFRGMIPSAHHSDFRMIHPILVAFCLGYVLAVDNANGRKVLVSRVGTAMPVLFIVLSGLYFLPKYGFIRKYLPAKIVRLTESTIRKPVPERTPWDSTRTITLRGDEIFEIVMMPHRDLAHIELSLDCNDVYEVQVFGATETRTFNVGPHKEPPPPETDDDKADDDKADDDKADDDKADDDKAEKPKPFRGLAHFDVDIEPTLEKVRAIRIRAKKGDRAYGLGHMIVSSEPRSGE